MSELFPLSQGRIIAILSTLPVPVQILRAEDDDLYYWNVEPTGHGTAALFEDAFTQALTYALTSRQEQISQEGKLTQAKQANSRSRTLDERWAVPFFNDVDPATWPIDGQWPDII